MLLQHCTWSDVDAYLQRSGGILLPMGSTEQHGPNGIIGTDAICAEVIAAAAGRIADALVAPTLSYGVAPFNLDFAGTVTVRASTFTQVLLDCLESLAHHGFTRVYCLNGHGGNIAPTLAAFSELYAGASLARTAAPPRCRLVSWWEYPRTNALRHELYGDSEGMHATPSEVAITQHAVPGAARPMALPPIPTLGAAALRRLAGDAHFDAAHHRRRYPDGRIGSAPDRASPEAGERLLALAAEEAAADYASFLAEETE